MRESVAAAARAAILAAAAAAAGRQGQESNIALHPRTGRTRWALSTSPAFPLGFRGLIVEVLKARRGASIKDGSDGKALEAMADESPTQTPDAEKGPGADDAMEIEPEFLELPEGKPQPHNPPPPPSLRGRKNDGTVGAGRSFHLTEDPRLVRDVMARKLFTVEPDATLERLEERMDAFAIRHLPVVEGNKLVGLITRSDLLHASSSFLSDHAQQRDRVIHTVAVNRVMQRELITVGPDDELVETATLMWEAKIRCLPVVESENRLVGILTESDFIRVAHYFLSRA